MWLLKETRILRQKITNSTWCSQAVTHPSTNHAQRCLTAVIRREPVFWTWYDRWRWSSLHDLPIHLQLRNFGIPTSLKLLKSTLLLQCISLRFYGVPGTYCMYCTGATFRQNLLFERYHCSCGLCQEKYTGQCVWEGKCIKSFGGESSSKQTA